MESYCVKLHEAPTSSSVRNHSSLQLNLGRDATHVSGDHRRLVCPTARGTKTSPTDGDQKTPASHVQHRDGDWKLLRSPESRQKVKKPKRHRHPHMGSGSAGRNGELQIL